MKRYIQTILLLVVLVAAAQTTKAQSPSWVPDKGYWVTESTKSNPRHTIIRYYLDNGQLIHTETINGTVVKINRNKVKMELKQHLQQVVVAWENGHPLQDTATLAWNSPVKKQKRTPVAGKNTVTE